jgi:hypothetical protein
MNINVENDMTRASRWFGWMMAVSCVGVAAAQAGPLVYDPQVGQPGSLGIAASSDRFVGWASSVVGLQRGPQNVANPTGPLASFGVGSNALGASNGTLVSLGDGGSITLGFDRPIADGEGADFAVFENGFAMGTDGLAYLELGFVEVSSNGVDFFRFAAASLTPTDTQVGGFGPLDARGLNNLAGKHVAGFGTPFDLSELSGLSPLLDTLAVRYVRIVDVIGSIDPALGSRDASGRLINDPYATPFASGGFDLDAVGVMNQAIPVPEPGTIALAAVGLGLIAAPRLRRMRKHATTARP